jgi:hypothetical protein
VTHGRLKLRRNFFSEGGVRGVIEIWNRIPATIKNERQTTLYFALNTEN